MFNHLVSAMCVTFLQCSICFVKENVDERGVKFGAVLNIF